MSVRPDTESPALIWSDTELPTVVVCVPGFDTVTVSPPEPPLLYAGSCQTRVFALEHGSCTITVLLAVLSPLGTTHLPECTAWSSKTLLPDAATRLNSWFV